MMRLKRILSRYDVVGCLVVLVICLAAVWPFLSRPGLPQQTDAELHIYRLHELSHLVRGGEIYPRWAPNFYHGYGYPIFNYYAPLAYYVGLVFELMPRLGPVAGVKAVFVLGLLAGALGLYGFVRDNWGRGAGYAAAAVFVYAPYVLYVDPHARGVLAESFSFGMLPLALWSLDRLRREATGWRWATAVLTTALVILSHNLMALLFFSVLTAWAGWHIVGAWLRKTEAGPPYRLLAALGLGLGAAAFFWLPVYWERNAVNLNTLLGEGDNFDFRTHFLSWRTLLAGTVLLDWGATEPAVDFNLGAAQWVLGGLGVILWLARRTRHAFHVGFFAAATAVLFFLMLPASRWVWETVPFLPFFQFPWRLLGGTVIMLAVLAGAGTEALARLSAGRVPAAGVTAVFVLFPMLLGLPLTEPPPWPPFGEVSNLTMTQIEHQGRWLGTTSTADYVPATVDMIPERNGNVVRGLYEGTAVDRINWTSVPEGTTIATESVRPLLTRYHIDAPHNFRLRLFLFDFPGWQVRIDGELAATELGRPEGFIVIPVPTGEHVIEVKFGGTPARTAAAVITLLSLAATAVIAWRAGHRLPDTDYGSAQQVDRWVLAAALGVTAVYLLLVRPSGILHLHSTGLTAEAAQTAVFADFGGQIALIGYDVSATTVEPGETVAVTLYWKAQRPLDINYQSFLHLLAADGFLVAQKDKLNPSEFPTRRWPLDKYVRDTYRLTVPEGAAPGQYRVAAGLWVQTEGWRLPVLNEAGEQIGDNFTLFTLTVEP